MGILVHGSLRITLAPLCRLGRDVDCVVVEPHPSVSRSHAEIRWSRERWWIRDLNSRNGTWVSGERLGTSPRELYLSDTIRLGHSTTEWHLTDVASPIVRAHAGSGTCIEGDEALLALPTADTPAATVLFTPSGWVLETADGTRSVADGAEVEIAGQRLRLELPARSLCSCSTDANSSFSGEALVLTFRESLHAEYVQLVASRGPTTVDFGHRAHHELLVHLARLRLRDMEAGLPESEAGWVYLAELRSALGRDDEMLNLHIYRARKAFHAAGIADASEIIQRRHGMGQLRLGCRHLVISRTP